LNLGNASNNMAEAYAVYQGLLLTQEHHINHITIVGDSKNTIRYFVLGYAPKDAKLKRIIERTKLLLTATQAQFFHILRENNQGCR
jgi:ribonuclease HI